MHIKYFLWCKCMGESFQILSLKILNFTDFDSFSDLFSVCLKTIHHLIMKLIRYFLCLLRVLRFEFLKFRIFEFSPMQMLFQLLNHQLSPVMQCIQFMLMKISVGSDQLADHDLHCFKKLI